MNFKFYIIILFFLSLSRSYSQSKELVILDLLDNSPIENAHLKFENGLSFVSNQLGIINFKTPKNEYFTITHVSYNTFKGKISKVNDTIFLQTKFYELDEIVVSNKVIKTLKPKKAIGNLNPRNYGDGGAPLDEKLIYAQLIPNKSESEIFINEIGLEPTDYKIVNGKGKIIEKRVNHKYAPFKVDIFSVDSIYQIPGKSLLKNPITVSLKEGETIATAVFTEKILIDKHGFYIILIPFEKAYYETMGYKSAPAFKTIQATKEVIYLMFTKNLRMEGSIWKQDARNKQFNSAYQFILKFE